VDTSGPWNVVQSHIPVFPLKLMTNCAFQSFRGSLPSTRMEAYAQSVVSILVVSQAEGVGCRIGNADLKDISSGSIAPSD